MTTELQVVKAKQSLPARIVSRLGGGVVRVLLLAVALIWLMPTVGLLFSSLRSPADIAASGWWKVFASPSQMNFDNYSNLLDNKVITDSLLSTVLITVPATLLVVVIGSLAGYPF